MIGEMIGVPEERRKAFLEWTDALVKPTPSAAATRGWCRPATLRHVRKAPGRAPCQETRRYDLMRALLDTEIEGQRLGEEELLGFCFVPIVAGNDTTTNLIANGTVALDGEPGWVTSIRARAHRRVPVSLTPRGR